VYFYILNVPFSIINVNYLNIEELKLKIDK